MSLFQTVAVARLYRVIADQIAGRIRAGEFPRGGRLPSERELAEQLQVSRASIREALIAEHARVEPPTAQAHNH